MVKQPVPHVPCLVLYVLFGDAAQRCVCPHNCVLPVQHYKGIIPTIKSKIGNFVLRYMMYVHV